MEDKVFSKCEMDKYMSDLRDWLESVKEDEAEGMAVFFAKRINIYDNVHMEHWGEIYEHFSDFFNNGLVKLLDIGCGTGLELKSIYERFPDVEVTGIDLSKEMLSKLIEKYSGYKLNTINADYFDYDFSNETYDAVMSFETLHHFTYEKKQAIYPKIYQSLKSGGYYIECDYIACCEEEERLCREYYDYKRKKYNIPENEFIHIDIPLKLEHEIDLIEKGGFKKVDTVYRNCSTIIIKAIK